MTHNPADVERVAKAIEDVVDVDTSYEHMARAALSAMLVQGWQSIETAPYVVVGNIQEPTEAQMKRAALNGGWELLRVNGVDVLFNSCVSPPFAGGMYKFQTIQPITPPTADPPRTYTQAEVDAAVAEERERCAVEADYSGVRRHPADGSYDGHDPVMGPDVAATIRKGPQQ